MSVRALAPLAVAAALVFPAGASAFVRCVGTTGPDCTTTHATSGQAVGVALNGDTIRFGAGTFDPVDTPKVLTWVGVGAGTPESAAGATHIQQTAPGQTGMNLPGGGTVRSLRVEGGPYPGGMGVAGTGIRFAPTAPGDMTLTLVDVIATGGSSSTPFAGGTGLVLGETSTTGSKVANVTGGAFLGSATPTAGGTGVSTRYMRSTITGALIRTPAGGGVDADVDSTLTLDATIIEGVTGIGTQGADAVTVNRSRINAAGIGLFMRSASNGPINVSLRDSILFAGSTEGETAAAVTIEGATGDPLAFEAVGSTLVARGTSHGMDASRAADASAGITATLRNSIVRAEGTGADLLADRATIGADFSSFNTRTVENGGAAPEPGSGNNVAGDPLLAPDYSLQPGSPLIDRGDASLVLPGELDLAGAARSLDGSGDCVAVPDIGAFERPSACPAAPAPNLAPELADVDVTNKVFAPKGVRASAAARRRVKRGTRFRYTLSEAARVRIRIERRVRRRVRGRRVTRWRRVTTLVANEQAGRQGTAFSGRVRRRALRRGRYRARLVATDALGARSAERRVRFRIVRP